MIEKYGKIYGNMWKYKRELTYDNSNLVEKNRKLTEVYNSQPVRKKCKLCGGKEHRYDFHARGTKYWCCDSCGHLNGWFQDTQEYCKMLYEGEDGLFGGQYEDADIATYTERVHTIDSPKADSLTSSIRTEGTNDHGLKYVDVSAGSGQFVYSLIEKGYDAVGIEVDVHQVNHVNDLLQRTILLHRKSEDIVETIRDIDCDVISCIYGFEHIVNVGDVLSAINDNSKVQWVYFAVPTLSVCSMLDSVNPDVYWRVLHAAHTHVYSNESVEWLCNQYDWEKVAEWRFGSDAADLLRNIMVKAEANGDIEYAEECKRQFIPLIDDLQLIIDKHKLCLDTHVLCRKRQTRTQ